MKKKRIFLTFGLMLSLIFISATSAYAQEDMTSKNHYYELKFGDNFYLSAGAGFNLFMIQSIEGVDDDRPLKFVGALSLGKWITPYVGLRLEGVYGQLKIFDNAIDPVPSKNVGYMGVYGDFMWNASNTFGGYNPRRVVDIIPFAGVSYLKTVKKNFNGEKPHSFPMSAGIKINFRLAHYVDFFIQDRFTFTSDHFDGLVDGNFLEPIMSVTAGFTVNFGANRFIAYTPYEQRMLVNSLNDNINQLRR